MKKKFKQNNRGTTLVELMVIVAIMLVLIGSVMNLSGYLDGKQARQCSYKLEAALSEIRMETMSKSNGEKESVYFIIENRNGEIYARQMIKGTEKNDKIGQKVSIRVIDKSGASKDLEAGSSVSIYFDRSTGGLLEDAIQYTKIEVTQGLTTYIVEIEPGNGNVSCKKK